MEVIKLMQKRSLSCLVLSLALLLPGLSLADASTMNSLNTVRPAQLNPQPEPPGKRLQQGVVKRRPPKMQRNMNVNATMAKPTSAPVEGLTPQPGPTAGNAPVVNKAQ